MKRIVIMMICASVVASFGASRAVQRTDNLGQGASGRRAENSPSAQDSPSGLRVKTEKENVVASRLIGEWKTSASLSERLRGTAARIETLAFSEDASVASKVPEAYAEFLKDKQVY
ncbi:MAG: hypothetical protein HN383_07700, partial [Verrucomicrobia bacterium]|nr:hypothetical protein [Verrucomicrobiota bacterium]